MHIAAMKGWDAMQINVKTAFLYGILLESKVQYIKQLEEFKKLGKEDYVCKLL